MCIFLPQCHTNKSTDCINYNLIKNKKSVRIKYVHMWKDGVIKYFKYIKFRNKVLLNIH